MSELSEIHHVTKPVALTTIYRWNTIIYMNYNHVQMIQVLIDGEIFPFRRSWCSSVPRACVCHAWNVLFRRRPAALCQRWIWGRCNWRLKWWISSWVTMKDHEGPSRLGVLMWFLYYDIGISSPCFWDLTIDHKSHKKFMGIHWDHAHLLWSESPRISPPGDLIPKRPSERENDDLMTGGMDIRIVFRRWSVQKCPEVSSSPAIDQGHELGSNLLLYHGCRFSHIEGILQRGFDPCHPATSSGVVKGFWWLKLWRTITIFNAANESKCS